MSRHYTSDDHKAAFEAYMEIPTWVHVSRVVDIAPNKAAWWGSPSFKCKEGCPYHNYPALLREREVAVNENILILERGEGTESSSRAIVKRIVDENHNTNYVSGLIETLNKIVRSDLDRIAHWEYIYGMVFSQLTGLELSYDLITDRDGRLKADSRDYIKGMRIDKAEKCIYLLSHIQEQIEKLRCRVAPDTTGVANESQEPRLKIEDLRALMMTIGSPDVNVTINNSSSQDRIIDIHGREF